MLRLGLDIGGTKINIGIFDTEVGLISRKRLEVRDLKSPVRDICDAVSELCLECGITVCELISCGIGVPGTVSEDGRTLIKAPNISVLTSDFAVLLEEALGIPTRMVQDSRAGALGEYALGAGLNSRALLSITIGTGIGAGLVIDGKIYGGALGAAGEIGHIPALAGGRPCGCGKRGCVEKYSAGIGLELTAKELFGDGATAYTLFDKARAGDSSALLALDDAREKLALVITAAVNLLSPDCVVFTGGLAEEVELYLDPIIERVKELCYSSGALPRFEKAILGELAPLVGAALAFSD